MKGPAGVLALVLAETVAGAAALVFLTPLWNEVRRGFFKLTGFIVVALAPFMGAGIDGLLPGHWYLTDRKLTRRPISRFALALIGAVVLEAVAVIVGGFGPRRGNREFSALLTAAGLAPWVALGMIGT